MPRRNVNWNERRAAVLGVYYYGAY
jgi:hypothetical protein